MLLEQAGLRWPVARLARLVFLGCLLSFAASWYLLPAPVNRAAFLIGPVTGALPLLYVVRKSKRRLYKFEEQFPDGLEFVARAMRAGHAFSVSLEMLHREFQEPLAGEFRRTFDEQNLGLPLDMALQKLAARIPLLDVQFFVSAVLLQKRTGEIWPRCSKSSHSSSVSVSNCAAHKSHQRARPYAGPCSRSSPRRWP